ncbi:MAG: DUF2809 domain-containing protein [Neorhizobium sp.]|nr:DUF2809 domain-containing protein [Neorhizobium sp.]
MDKRQVRGTRLYRLAAAIGVIALGLALRRFGYDLGLTFPVVKYGGSVLWGAMVFLLAGALSGARTKSRLVIVAIVIAVAVEFFRLVHAPEIDAFRLTLPGQLLLGRVFSLWNIIAYIAGIMLAWVAEMAVAKRVNEARAPAS